MRSISQSNENTHLDDRNVSLAEPTSTVTGKADLFGHSGQAAMYRQFRPRYPAKLVHDVLSQLEPNNFGLYVDVACGPGTLTEVIAPRFQKSIGLDQSYEQLSNAAKIEGCNMEYIPGSAFAIPIESSTVDLVTVGQGLHWLLPYDLFFAEVLRILKPGGIFAALAYSFPRIKQPEGDRALREFYCGLLGAHLEPGTPGCWWETSRPTIDGLYERIPFPREVTRKVYREPVRMRVCDFTNYLKTLSAYRTYLRSGNEDPLPGLEQQILASLSEPSREAVMDIEIPFFTVCFAK